MTRTEFGVVFDFEALENIPLAHFQKIRQHGHVNCFAKPAGAGDEDNTRVIFHNLFDKKRLIYERCLGVDDLFKITGSNGKIELFHGVLSFYPNLE
jgi:hypothetical protein